MSHPLTAVHVQRRRSAEISLGCASMQGWRPEHEDSHVISPSSTGGLFGICDGHAGSRAAAFTARRLPVLLSSCDFANEQDSALIAAFLTCDAEYRKEPMNTDGCTAVYCHLAVRPGTVGGYSLTVMNIGDSRCLLIRPSLVSPTIGRDFVGNPMTATDADVGLVFETKDHKPDESGERARIEKAGGFVSQDDPARLDGVIAVSRVIGDFAYKNDDSLLVDKQKMIAVPDITRLEARTGDILVLACDGLFETMDSRELARQIVLRMHGNADLGAVAKDVVMHSLQTESKDNMTLIISLIGGGSQNQTETCIVEEELHVGEYSIRQDQRDKYEAFFRKTGFPSTPSACEVCGRVYKHMSQCPCRAAVYCSVGCQRAAWKDHKKKCAAHKSSKH